MILFIYVDSEKNILTQRLNVLIVTEFSSSIETTTPNFVALINKICLTLTWALAIRNFIIELYSFIQIIKLDDCKILISLVESM